MTRKFFQIKKNKRESWEKDIYPLLFKSLQYSMFSELVNKAFSKVSYGETNIKSWLNLIQGVLRYKAEDRLSAARIHEHPLMAHFFQQQQQKYLNQILCE